MAIVVEEKSTINWVAILSVIVVILLLFGGGYYLFFKKPQLIEVVLPANLDPLNQISQITIEPEEVIQSASFKNLRSFSTDLTIPPAGRSNPFRPF